MTQEEKDRISNQRGMVMPNRFDSGLGSQGVPAFPSNFSNIGPSEQKAGPTRFSGGAPATMGIGGINSAYPSSLGLSGRDYAPMRDQSGETIYRGGQLGLSQPQSLSLDQPFSFKNNASGGLATEGYNFRLPSTNNFALPLQTSIPIEGGPLSVGINRAQTAGQMGRIAMQNPYGTIFATEQQQANMNAQRTPDQQSSRTPEQQQALLAQMRTRGAAIGRDIAGFQENFFQAKREERKVAEAMKGTSGSDSYYRSQPSSIADIQRDAANYKAVGFDKMSGYVQDSIRGVPPSNAGAKPAFGSGASFGQGVYFNPAPYEPIPMPVVDRTGRRIGTTEDTRVKRAADDETRVNPFIPRELQG